MLTEYIKFYYGALSEIKKKIYVALYNGFRDKQKSIEINVDITAISIDEMHDIITSVYNDTPSFYYLKATSISIATTLSGYRIFPEYIYSNKQIEEFDRQLETGLQKFCKEYIQQGMSDYQKEIIIHDFLVKTIKYDHEAANCIIPQIDEAYNVLGALLKRKAVCWGIACAFKLLCDYCKVKSFVVIGDTKPKLAVAGHAWNMVKLDGESYHVDVTWDIKEKGDISFCYDYLNLDDNLIQFDHSWESTLYPRCSSNRYNYYYLNHLYVKSIGKLTEFITQKLKLGEKYIAIKFANTMPTEGEINNAINLSFSNSEVCGRYIISNKTHNIYIEVL